MGFDYDGYIEKLKEWNAEDEETAARAEAAGETRIAEWYRKSASRRADSIIEVEAIRDSQSA